MFSGKAGKAEFKASPSGLYLLEHMKLGKNQYQIVFDKDVVLDKFIDVYKAAGGYNSSVKPGIVD